MSTVGLLAMILAALAAALTVPVPVTRPARTTRRRVRDPRVPPLIGALGIVAVGYLVLGGVPGVLAGMAGGALSWRLLGRLERRVDRDRRESLQRSAPLVADLVAAALAAGRDPGSALRLAAESVGAPAREELAVYYASLSLGADPAEVWQTLATHRQFGGVGRAFLRATETGGSVAEAMRRGADDLRELDRSTREADARSVSTRAAVPLGLCLLPAFVVVGVVPLVASAVQQLLS